jgi:hypothetical protein
MAVTIVNESDTHKDSSLLKNIIVELNYIDFGQGFL